jgi:hypothetical protein
MGSPQAGLGKRQHFSFHYGLASAKFAPDGFPETKKPETPYADLRIDIDRHLKPHVHINSPDHISQCRIGGYSIKDADMIKFLRAVIEHRKTKQPLHELLKIKVLPKGSNG